VHHRKMSEFGNMTLVEDRDDDSAGKIRLPGVKKGDMASRSFKPEVRVSCVRFSPTGNLLNIFLKLLLTFRCVPLFHKIRLILRQGVFCNINRRFIAVQSR